ncbi:hypothetical protein V6Z93_007411 [Aspergillus fumigatus]
MFSGTRLENAFDGLAVRSTPYIWVSFYSAISTVIKYLVEKNAGTSHFSSTCLSLLQEQKYECLPDVDLDKLR